MAVINLTKMDVFEISQNFNLNYFSFLDITVFTDEVSKQVLINPTDSLEEIVKFFSTDFKRKKSSVVKKKQLKKSQHGARAR